ncbi:MAG TPA: M56 family metallopeptidase [Pseudomonadales bacterium]
MYATMETLTDIAAFFGVASLKGTLIVALVLIAQKVFSRFLSANGRYLLWLAVVISLVTPVGFEIALPELVPDRPVVERLHAQSPPGAEHGVTALAGSQSLLKWQFAVPMLWLAGVLAVLAAMGASSRRFAALARNGAPAPAGVESALRACAQQAGCTSAIRLLASAELRAPVVAGLLRPALLWPAGLEASLTPVQLQHVLMHEVTHVKRRDIFSACVVAVLQALHWFNPAVWIAFSWLREDREMACDAATVRTLGGADAHAYAHTLIQLGAMPLPARSRIATGLDMLDGPAQLRKRIHMLAQAADPTARHFLSMALLLALSALAFSQPAAPRVPAPTALLHSAPQATRQPAPVGIATGAHAVSEVTVPPALTASIDAPAPFAAIITSESSAPPARIASRVATAPHVEQQAERIPEPPARPVLDEPVYERSVAPMREQLLAFTGSVDVLPAHTFEHRVAEELAVAAAPTSPAPVDTNDELICRNVETSGSRIRTRLCLAEEQWAEGYRVPRSTSVRAFSPTYFIDTKPLGWQ